MDTERFRKLLVDERERVSSTVESLHESNSRSFEEETEEETYDNHLADSATATLNREIDSTLEENSGHVLVGIDEALDRIENGTFDPCALREADRRGSTRGLPYATRCIDCQRLAERA